MKLQDLTVNDCIVSSTPEEWATVQNIFRLAGHDLQALGNVQDTFEKYPITIMKSANRFMNVAFPKDEENRIPAAQFIVANVPPAAGVPVFGEVEAANLPELTEYQKKGKFFGALQKHLSGNRKAVFR